jgi:glucose-1-phosphate adenylyltransferase
MNATSTDGLARTQALILAGGRGERLFPLTTSRPKPAIPFGGRFRIVDFTLLNCLNSKVGQVAMLTQYRHEELHGYIRQRWSEFWNRPGDASRQLVCLPPASGKRYRGTADAVFQNLPVIHSNGSEHVVILSGDHVYAMDYRELLSQHVETNADVTIATVEYPIQDATHFGVVEVDANFRVTGFQEKPRSPRPMPLRPDMALISMGVYVFKRDVLTRSLLENCERAVGYDFGHHIIPALIGCTRVFAFDFRDEVENSPRYWRDIGTIDSYYRASMDLVQPMTPFKAHMISASHPAAVPEVAARVSGSAHVSHSVLSSGVRIEKDASIENSVLMPGVRVGRGAAIRRAIIEEGIQIPADFRVGFNIERDRKHYTNSPNGVVVVSETPNVSKPVVVRPLREKIAATLKPAEAREHAHNVA